RVGAAGSKQPTQDRLDGLVLENLTTAHRKRFNIDPEVKSGVVVTEVEPGSAAARAGLRPGDVIIEVNRSKVSGVEAFKRLYGQRSGMVLLLVQRGDSTVYVVMRR